MKTTALIVMAAATLLMVLPPAMAAQAAAIERDARWTEPAYSHRTVQYRECSQRVGPFVTQSTAWQRLNAAKSQGYATSGVFPCYSGGSRGYCFNVFYAC